MGTSSSEPSPINIEERQRLIEEVAYARFARRGFIHGRDLDDWLAAEAHVDSIISGRRDRGSSEAPEPELQQSGGRSIARDERMKRIVRQHPQRDEPKI
ncbi:MAG TPA: DUF2934 domain-containing protein [Burkholderiales bacterium]|nr:DUF2934 domain-containing protein [Burkholderiales bacterium]